MDFEQKMKLCEQWFAEDFKIDQWKAHRIIYDLSLEDIMTEHYAEELENAEQEYLEQQKAEAEHNREHYNDGWSDHEGV